MLPVRKPLASLALSALLAVPFLAGCGGTNSILGQNSNAEVRLSATNVQQSLQMTIAPRSGAETDSTVCSATQLAFCSARSFETNNIVYNFTTESAASSNPYYVYVKNVTSTPATATLVINLDGSQKLNTQITVPANSSARYARIFRNSADTK